MLVDFLGFGNDEQAEVLLTMSRRTNLKHTYESFCGDCRSVNESWNMINHLLLNSKPQDQLRRPQSTSPHVYFCLIKLISLA